MNDLQRIFDYQGKQLRIVIINDEPWFVAKDVCEILDHSNHKVAVNRLDNDEVKKVYLIDALGREQETIVINEAGLYSLILTSNKKEARLFKRWVTHEVLPQIRKTGTYISPNKQVEEYLNMSEEDRAILYFQTLKEKKQLEKQNALLQPKAELYDLLLSAGNSQTIGEVAKAFGIGRNKLFNILREHGILIKNGPMRNTPYQKYLDAEYFEVREVSTIRGDSTINVTQTLVTAKGIDFIGRLLKKTQLTLIK